MPQTVWITRHGNRYDFVNPQWFNTAERPYDPHLSDDGILQAQELGKRLKSENIAYIFASPFLRTVQTAHYVAEVLDLPIQLEAGLSEWLNPEWMPRQAETLPREILAQRYPRINLNYRDRVVPQYPETQETVMERTAQTIQKLVAQFCEDLLIVGHGASVLGTARGLLGRSPMLNASFCCLVKLVRHDQSWTMELNGDTSHLSCSESVVRFN